MNDNPHEPRDGTSSPSSKKALVASSPPSSNKNGAASSPIGANLSLLRAMGFSLLFLLSAILIEMRYLSSGDTDSPHEGIEAEAFWASCPLGMDYRPRGNDAEFVDPRHRLAPIHMFPDCDVLQLTHSRSSGCSPGHVRLKDDPLARPHRNSMGPPTEQQPIPRNLHLALPSRCVSPASRSFLLDFRRRYFPSHSLFVHDDDAVDRLLSQRREVFPEATEAALCAEARHDLEMATYSLNKTRLATVGNARTGPRGDLGTLESLNSLKSLGNLAREGKRAKRDLWRYMMLWEYGGVIVDGEALLLGSRPVRRGTSESSLGWGGMEKAVMYWTPFVSSPDEGGHQSVEYIPSSTLIAATPQHQLIFYIAKWALSLAMIDSKLPYGKYGRITDADAMIEGLSAYVPSIDYKSPLNTIHDKNGTPSVLFLNRNLIDDLFGLNAKLELLNSTEPSNEYVNNVADMGSLVAQIVMERKEAMHDMNVSDYLPAGQLFSCMDYRLDMYLNKVTEKFEQ